jgi:hypothetical protein
MFVISTLAGLGGMYGKKVGIVGKIVNEYPARLYA